jgi:hypothetical protein
MCCVCKAFRVGLEFHKPFSSTGAYSHQRCMVGSGRRFVDDSALEEGGFELSVPPERKPFRGVLRRAALAS